MTSPQPPGPPPRAAAGNGVNEQTLHLPTVTALSPRTAPSPYPARPAFRPPPPPPAAETGPVAPAPAPAPVRTPSVERWEGTGFRTDIQGLRAVAVVLVLLSHAGVPFFDGGYVGVDVFFVLSGFLITSLLIKEVFDTGRISLAGFYARRARRILPAASAVTIATVVGAWLWFPVSRLEAVMQDAFTVIVYVVNYRFIAQQTEYLNADQMPSPFQQYWSLAVEEQFYVVWPLLLIGLLSLVGRAPRKLVSAGLAACTVIFAISLILSVFVTEQSQPTAYYAAHTRAWELAAGAVLALTLPTWRKTPKAMAWTLGIAGLAMVIAAGVMYTEDTAFPGYTALLPVVGTMLVIVAGTSGAAHPVGALLGSGPFQFVGKISYSLYLWHWPILILIPLAADAESSVLLNTVLILSTFAVAQLSYAYIEEPIRKARKLKSGNLWGLLIGVVCSLLAIGMILTFTVVFSKTAAADDPVDMGEVDQDQSVSQLEQRLTEGLETETVPDTLTPSLAGAYEDKPITYAQGCHVNAGVSALPDGCVYGDPDSETMVVLVGDSHAAQWFPALESIAAENGWALLSRTKSSCTPVSVPIESTGESGEDTACWDWKRNVFAEIDELEPELVIIGNADVTPVISNGGDPVQQWEDGWTDTLARVTASAGAVVTFADTPWATDQAAADCLSLHQDDVRACVEEEPYVFKEQERRQAGIEAAEAAGVPVIDPRSWFCVADGCPLIVNDVLVYRDTHHMTTPYSLSLAGVLEASLPAL